MNSFFGFSWSGHHVSNSRLECGVLLCELQSEILQALLTDRSRVGSNGVSGQDVGIGHYYIK